MIGRLFRDWQHSLAGTWSHGHFHLTIGLAALGAIVALVLAAVARMRGSRVTPETVIARNSGVPMVICTVIGAGVVVFLATRPKPKVQAVPRPVIHHTTVIQHIAAHPGPNGLEITAMVIVTLLVLLVLRLANR